jgi:hypothetical protein
MADGFLSRWAQRKLDARQGKPLVEPEPAAKPAAQPVTAPPLASPVAVQAPNPTSACDAAPAVPTAPPPTLQEAQALGQGSDFRPFIAKGVDPAVRNAAMKKLFADPHYNVMDRLDTYIDDYSQADPLPLSMLRQMASAQFLKLVDEEPESAPPAADAPIAPPTATNTTTTRRDHAHTDLRLQPDHAPGEPDPGRGAE